jgi:hypothetical protein
MAIILSFQQYIFETEIFEKHSSLMPQFIYQLKSKKDVRSAKKNQHHRCQEYFLQ